MFCSLHLPIPHGLLLILIYLTHSGSAPGQSPCCVCTHQARSHLGNISQLIPSVLGCSLINLHGSIPPLRLIFNKILPFPRGWLCPPYFKWHPISGIPCLLALLYFIFIALFITHHFIELLTCLLHVFPMRR